MEEFFNFQGLVTLTLDRVKLHTAVHHSSTSTYTPNFIEIEDVFCGQTYIRTYRHLSCLPNKDKHQLEWDSTIRYRMVITI